MLYLKSTKLHSENSVIAKAPLEKVFAAMEDVTALPKYSTVITKCRETGREGNIVYTETEAKFMGRVAKSKEKHVFTPPARHEFEGESNGGKTKTVMTLVAVPEGTRIDTVWDIELKGVFARLFGSMAKGQVKKIFDKEISALAKYAESTK